MKCKNLIVLILCGLLTGCDIILDQLFDCIDQDEPEFSPNHFPAAMLNQPYSYTILASINNNPFDSSYNYTITFSGNLPGGLRVARNENDRTISIIGTPIETGQFHFTLRVDVSDPNEQTYQSGNVYDDGDTLCNSSHTQNFSITVN